MNELDELRQAIKSIIFDVPQAERDSLRKQLETVQRELTASADAHAKYTNRIHELEKENITFKNRVEEVLHKGKVDVTDMKMEMLKQRGDLERERDTLRNKVEGTVNPP